MISFTNISYTRFNPYMWEARAGNFINERIPFLSLIHCIFRVMSSRQLPVDRGYRIQTDDTSYRKGTRSKKGVSYREVTCLHHSLIQWLGPERRKQEI